MTPSGTSSTPGSPATSSSTKGTEGTEGVATRVRALRVHEHGGRDQLRLDDLECPSPGPGQVLVEVAAAGVNFIDVYQREGIYPMTLPFTIGQEGAGTVRAVGEGVSGVAVGDRVAWPFTLGSAASHVVIAADKVVPVPDGLDLDIAAAAMLQGCTAHYLTRSTYAVQPRDAVLVHAAAGGVGQLLVQLAKSLGARVVATAGGPEKCAIASRLGADVAIDYSAFDATTPEGAAALAAAVRDAAGGGVAAAYDGVGRATFDASLASLRPRGVLALFGAASGPVPPVDLQRLNAAGSVFVTRPTLGHYLLTRDELLWRTGEVFAALIDGTLQLQVGGRYPLSEAARAYEDLEGRRTTGKLVLLP